MENGISDSPEITGSIAVTGPDATFIPPSDGMSFVVTARQLWHGARVLSESESDTALPGALLAAQALEGGLKALLWTTGQAASALSRKPLGHDLNALWNAAAKTGLIPTSAPDWCACLNALHAPPFHGRYPSGLNGIGTPNAKQVVKALDRVLLLAENAVKTTPWRKPGA